MLREALENQVQKQLEVSTNTRFFRKQLAKQQQDPGNESIQCLGPVNCKLLSPTSLQQNCGPSPKAFSDRARRDHQQEELAC